MNELYKRREKPGMEITTSIGCAVNCKFCPQKVFVKRYTETGGVVRLSFKNFKICIDKIPSYVDIIFGGFAECFQNEDCIDMIRYAAKGHDILLYSSLRGLKMNQAEKALQVEYKKCVIHIPDAQGYAAIPITNEYRDVLKLFLRAKKLNGENVVSHLSCQGAPHQDIYDVIEGYYILSELEDRAGALDDAVVQKSPKALGSIICRHCGSFLNKNMLMPNGDVLLCCNDWSMKHILGNLLHNDYDSITYSREKDYVRRGMLVDFDNDILCRSCIQAKNINELEMDTWQTEKRKEQYYSG